MCIFIIMYIFYPTNYLCNPYILCYFILLFQFTIGPNETSQEAND